jgi:N-acetylmuramoyl-L-alanine amidase
MKFNFAFQTFIALVAWLLFENFNEFKDGLQPRSKSTDSCLTNYRIRKIVLDAGHGGKDPGCLGASSKEKNNTLGIILKLGELIEGSYPDIQVIYTRNTDVFIELNERAAIANRNNADLFISVHCNSIPSAKVNGTETYVLGVDRAQHNLEVAKRENAVISLEENYQKNYGGYDPNSPEAHILSSVWQSAYLEQSILFASMVQENAKTIAEREDKGVKQAGFLVLRETAMPAVLIESGYLTNRTEEAYIASDEGQSQMAEAIFKAFESYKNKMEGTAPGGHTKHRKQVAAATPAPKTTVNKPKAAAKPVSRQITATAPEPGFRIFLFSWPSRLDPKTGLLSLLDDINEEQVGGKFYYYTGNYSDRATADKVLPEIKNLGFKTATVVPGK